MKFYKIALFILVFEFTIQTMYAQIAQMDTDSLERTLQATETPDSVRAANMFILAFMYKDHDIDKAMDYTERFIKLSHDIGWQIGITEGPLMLATLYYFKGDYIQSIAFYKNALETERALRDTTYRYSAEANLALIHLEIENFDQAEELLLPILEHFDRKGEDNFVMLYKNSLGQVNEGRKNWHKALDYYHQSLEMCNRIKPLGVKPRLLTNIGFCHLGLDEPDSAMFYFNSALEIPEKLNSPSEICYTKYGISKLLYKSSDLKAAAKYAEEVIAISNSIGIIEYLSEMYDIISSLHEHNQEYKLALDSRKEAIFWRDSIMNNDKKLAIVKSELEIRHDYESKLQQVQNEQQLAVKEAEIQRQRALNYSTFGGAAMLLLFGGVGFVFYRKRREAQFSATVANTEMKALRAQMNPHFIFNALNSVTRYIDRNDKKAANEFLAKFGQLMRMTLVSSEEKQVLLSDDLRALELYMQLESERLENGFEYSIEVDPEIDTDNTLVPSLILQPFVENSIWHGFDMDRKGKIDIRIKMNDGMLLCEIEDNGIGRQKAAERHKALETRERKSFGTKITQARIDIINAIEKAKARINFSDLASGTLVEVRLPLMLKY